jgi:hypothetical protein
MRFLWTNNARCSLFSPAATARWVEATRDDDDHVDEDSGCVRLLACWHMVQMKTNRLLLLLLQVQN